MPFGLCNAPGTFQRCLMAIFSDMVEKKIEVFMDDFSVTGSSFDNCLENLRSVLIRCEETTLYSIRRSSILWYNRALYLGIGFQQEE